MTTVRISYDPDLSKIGTIREVDAAEARQLVRRGRATYAKGATVSAPAPFEAPPDTQLTAAQAQVSWLNEAAAGNEAGETSLDLDQS